MVLICFCSRGISIDRQEGISHGAGASQWCKLKPGVAGGRGGQNQQPVSPQGEKNSDTLQKDIDKLKGEITNREGTTSRLELQKGTENNRFGDFTDVICYNCGLPDHHKASCKKPMVCFICKEDHVVDTCPMKKQGHYCAKYIGSAASVLGFYHIEVPEEEHKLAMDLNNYGKVYIETREISKEELQLELATCFNPHWPWQIRQIEEWCFLVRFPPNKKVEDI
jgi:hypothetical protein